MTEATGWYVYGVVPSALAPAAGLPAVEHGALAALVASVPLDEYGEDALPERLNDRPWLEARVQAHNDVLQRVAAGAPVVPFRFGPIYRERDDVRAMLEARDEELSAALAHVAGRVELGVKAWAPADRPVPAAAPAATGRAYLEQRLGARDRARDTAALHAEAAADAHARLLACSVEGVANRPQPRELTGRAETMILNGAYLVADQAPLREEAERLGADYADQGIVFELTGPWPPYNFVAIGAEA